MLEGIPILTLLILVPLIGAIVTLLSGQNPKVAKYLALVFSAITLVMSLILLLSFDLGAGGIFGQNYQFEEQYQWAASLGISWIVGVDGISIPMVFLTALLCFLAILFSWDVKERTKQYMGLMLVLEVGVMGVFMSLDYFLFYVFWEIVLIPMFFLIGIWGGPRREYASIKFFIYTHIASLVMLLAIFAMYFQARPGQRSTCRPSRSPAHRSPTASRWGYSWRCSSASSSRCRSCRSIPGCRTRTSRPRPPGRCCWPACC